MFHTFLHPISDFSGGASPSVGIALPPIAVIATGAIDLDQQFSPQVSALHATTRSASTTTLEDWLDQLPTRGWDA
ncbi:hypothetical protein SAMN05216368_10716 [Cryobacterium flavum]|uniref:Uncharacterized protein n=1 Tax=Cryobacterium flavum TaxID=1424659 RepID=A0A4R8V068_9MICO|nr:hypothetical protein E3O21_11830 [Cryobacterium flavum]SDN72543.1 hypothetical protein SAMN05216368_10716 [Cryobacterium flavum]